LAFLVSGWSTSTFRQRGFFPVFTNSLDHADDDPPDPGSSLPAFWSRLAKPCRSALLGTTIAAVFALAGQSAGGKDIVPSNIFRFPVRRFLDSIRGVDTLIWALVWTNVVGLGRLPVCWQLRCRISAHSQAVLRSDRAADKKQVEGIRASGGNALARNTLWPDAAGAAVIAGQVLYFIESNTTPRRHHRIVGCRRHRLQLARADTVCWNGRRFVLIPDVLVAVAAIDWISGKLRFAIIGRRAVA